MTKKDNTSLLTVAGLKDLFAIEKKPLGGLMVFEKVAIAYAALTTLSSFFSIPACPTRRPYSWPVCDSWL